MRVIVALDLDGTVLDCDSALPQQAIAGLLSDVRRLGGCAAVMTARPIQDVARLFAVHEEPLDVWASDGAVRGKVARGVVAEVRWEAVLGTEAVLHTVVQLADNPHQPEILMFSTSQSSFEISAYGTANHFVSEQHLRRVGDVRPLRRLSDRGDLEDVARGRDHRAVGFLGPAESVQAVASNHRPHPAAQYLTYLETRIPGLAWFDVLAPGISKGEATRILRAENAADLVVAAGNGANDISMFAEANIGICPVDADPRLREIATHPTALKCGGELVSELQRVLEELAS